MQTPYRGDITKLLDSWRLGDRGAEDLLIARLYPDLERLAAVSAAKNSGGGVWQANELLHEAFLHLREQRQVHWKNRKHFFSIAARVLRRTVIDAWRHKYRQKRGGGLDEVPLEDARVSIDGAQIDRLALEQALRRLADADPVAVRLADADPVAARAVELLAIEGFSYEEAAKQMGVGRATVSRGWRLGRAFLRLQLGASD